MAVDDKKRLSIWWLRDDERREHDLNRLVVALTIQGGHCEEFSYATVDIEAISDLALNIVETAGTTVDGDANALHRDIVEPSVEQICAVTLRLAPADTIQPKEVGRLIAERVNAGSISRDDLPEDIEEKLISWAFLERKPHAEDACEEARNALKVALDEWEQALTAYRESVEPDPSTTDHKKLDMRVTDTAKAVKIALSRARRIWRSHPAT